MTIIFIFMSKSTTNVTSFGKESNKLVGSSNFLPHEKRIDLILIEN